MIYQVSYSCSGDRCDHLSCKYICALHGKPVFLPIDIYDEKHGIMSMKHALGVYMMVLTGRIIK